MRVLSPFLWAHAWITRSRHSSRSIFTSSWDCPRYSHTWCNKMTILRWSNKVCSYIVTTQQMERSNHTDLEVCVQRIPSECKWTTQNSIRTTYLSFIDHEGHFRAIFLLRLSCVWTDFEVSLICKQTRSCVTKREKVPLKRRIHQIEDADYCKMCKYK